VAEAVSSVTDSGYNDGMRWHFESRVDEARQLAPNRLARYTDLLGRAPRELLEVGCGTGAFGPAWGELGIRWQGVELNPESAAFAREHSLHVEQGDFLRYEGPPVDVVVASQVLEHVLAPRAFLRKVAAVLRPGGLLHLDVPNHGGLAARIRTLPGVGRASSGSSSRRTTSSPTGGPRCGRSSRTKAGASRWCGRWGTTTTPTGSSPPGP
jgi:SAM-dependent methyltransferase